MLILLQRQRGRKTKTDVFHQLVHSPNTCNRKVSPKQVAYSSIWFFHMGGQGPNTPLTCCIPGYITASGEQHWKNSGWD